MKVIEITRNQTKKFEGQSLKFPTFEMELKNWQQHILWL